MQLIENREKGRSRFNVIFLLAGTVFLTDPNFNMRDILPDFVGYILILASLSYVSYIDDRFAAAKKILHTAVGYSILKFVIFILISLAGPMFKYDDNTLLFTFVFSLVDLIILIFLYRNLLGGIETYLTLSGNEKINGMLFVTRIFWVISAFVKFITQLLPETPFLLSDSVLDFLSIKYNTYISADTLKSNLFSPCMIVNVLSAALVLSIAVPFFIELSKCSDFKEFILKKIDEYVLGHKFFFVEKTISSAFLLFAAGMLFVPNLVFDGINFLPDFLCGVLFIAGLSTMARNKDFDFENGIAKRIRNLFRSFAVFSFISFALTITLTVLGNNVRFMKDENLLLGLSLTENVFYETSVVILFYSLINMFDFLFLYNKKQQDFSIEYLGKYISAKEKIAGEKNIYIYAIFFAAFILKALRIIMPNSGDIMFFCSLFIFTFAFLCTNHIFKVKNRIFSYFKTK